MTPKARPTVRKPPPSPDDRTGRLRMRYLVIGAVAIAVLFWVLRVSIRRPVRDMTDRDLTAGERKVRQLIHDVHGAAVVSESFVREEGDTFVKLELDKTKSKVSKLE